MITLPKKPKVVEKNKNQTVFEIEDCYPGYGITLGNAFRRILLSSLYGAAITGIKIKGVQHEFSDIPHVKEDVVNLILNLKQVRFKMHTDKLVKATLKIKGEKQVKGSDIKSGPELEVVSKDAHIANLTNKKADLEIEIDVEPGLGYSPIEDRKKRKLEVGKIAIDAIFSPVQKVTYKVENMRVGERTDYDRIRINIETDGSITPEEAFLKAANILVDHFKVFTLLGKKEKKEKKVKKEKKKEVKEKVKVKVKEDVTKKKINELKISTRTITILESAGVKTVASLSKKNENDLEKIEGIGNKGIIEIKRALGKLGLTLKSR